MELENLIARAETNIQAPIETVWDALVNPQTIKKYMFGTEVISDWKKGSEIHWKGEWKGKSYEDKGVILEINPPRKLQYSHFSPLAGQADRPENYHQVTISLSENGAQTAVVLTQDKNSNDEEVEHSEKNWQTMLDGLKKLLENK